MHHKIFKNILLVCDMDGTLLNGLDAISPENKKAMQYFVDHGGRLTVATGRKETSVEPFLSDIPVNAPAILYNGSIIYDFETKSNLWGMELHGGIDELLIGVSNRFPKLGVEVYKENQILLVKENPYTEFHRSKEYYPRKFHSIDDISFPWRKVLLAAEAEELSNVEEYLEEYFRDIEMPFRMCRSERIFLEWLPLGVSKGNALDVLKQKFGYLDYTIITVGNETNDLEMLRDPYIGFAVANAHPEAIRAAKYECAHHDDHAIADVVAWIENAIQDKGSNL